MILLLLPPPVEREPHLGQARRFRPHLFDLSFYPVDLAQGRSLAASALLGEWHGP